jgi:hypothetical protein
MFKCVAPDALEIGKMYKIKRYMGKHCVTEKGTFIKRSDPFVYFNVTQIRGLNQIAIRHPFDNKSVFYEMVSQKHKIQEAMELRAFRQIMRSLIEYY